MLPGNSCGEMFFPNILEGFVKLWKVIVPFSRKILEKGGFQSGYGKVLEKEKSKIS